MSEVSVDPYARQRRAANMKVKIKTAHGYLSFQPDGRLEYRQAAGPWEEIDIEGLVFPSATSAEGVSKGTGASEGPRPSQSSEYVAAIKAQLQAQGVSLTGPCGAFEVTKRVAWGLRAQGVGLLSKPGGNNCNGYATDYLVLPNGDGVDILSDGGGNNGPQWSVQPGEFAGSDRWRAPVSPE
jgi:hypothetical protein